jgi:hypothetical protein
MTSFDAFWDQGRGLLTITGKQGGGPLGTSRPYDRLMQQWLFLATKQST